MRFLPLLLILTLSACLEIDPENKDAKKVEDQLSENLPTNSHDLEDQTDQTETTSLTLEEKNEPDNPELISNNESIDAIESDSKESTNNNESDDVIASDPKESTNNNESDDVIESDPEESTNNVADNSIDNNETDNVADSSNDQVSNEDMEDNIEQTDVTQDEFLSIKLSWIAPTRNELDEELETEDIDAYIIYWGDNEGNLDTSIVLSSQNISYEFEPTKSGYYYFSISAVTVSGGESKLSNIVSKYVN